MTAITLFPQLGNTRFIELSLKNTRQGIEFILFSLENLYNPGSDSLSLSISERGNKDFATINFQQEGENFFFQVYISENNPPLEEGWYNLIENPVSQSPEELISTVWDEPGENFFQARFADGLMLSKSLLVSKNCLDIFLSKHTDNLESWLKSGNLINLGII